MTAMGGTRGIAPRIPNINAVAALASEPSSFTLRTVDC
jgi:hypothetical protein